MENSNNIHLPQSTDEAFQADLAKAIAESIQLHKHQRRNDTITTKKYDYIVLDDSDIEEGDENDNKHVKIPESLHRKRTETISNAVGGGANDECSLFKEAIRQSLEEAKVIRNQYCTEKLTEEDEMILPRNICRKLSRIELHDAIDEFVNQQGGYERVESGQLIKHGNTNDMKKSCIADGGGKHQTGAQYGRYSILEMWRVFDVLEGKADISIDNNYECGNCDRNDHSNKESCNRLTGLPGARITSFVDIGHGIGIQVLQAGWSLGVPARGVEIMKDRHLVAVAIKEGVIESLRNDPPDSTAVELKLADFSWAIVPDEETEKRDDELHSFLLFEDKSKDIQQGLVIFINNAEEVFGPRSNQNAKGKCLDAHLATLFSHMQIGGRMVTLTDISCYLLSTGWFRHDVFKSGPGAVSWGNGNKSVVLHVITKLSDEWFCQNNKCIYMKYASSCQQDPSSISGAPNAVVNEFGELNEKCLYCQAPARRCSRFRNPARKRKNERGC